MNARPAFRSTISLLLWAAAAGWAGPTSAQAAPETTVVRDHTAKRPWSLDPLRDHALPPVKDAAWPATTPDHFILAKMESVGLNAAAKASKLRLIRRVTFDLTGLPPTPEEIDAFVNDNRPEAFPEVVDRLLASRHYGEHWGRHWLDVVRYADTAGDTADFPLPDAWRYRNYVIDSFNADKPYDQFIREQIAGDILAREGPRERYAEQVTATGFLALSRRFGFDSENYHHLTIQDTIDTLGQSILGLTVGCARCHDHKFDPIPMQDYYGLYGIFDSTRYPFPGSEQKQKTRSTVPLVPREEAQAKWRDMQAGFASLGLAPGAVLRSLDDMDGDFELQKAAAGGSNGVLVPPWFFEGRASVTAAQSPFRHLHPFGTVGVSVAEETGKYAIRQTFHPARPGGTLYVNLEFRVSNSNAAALGQHRLAIGLQDSHPAVEVLISSNKLSFSRKGEMQDIPLPMPGGWHCLQLSLDLDRHSFTVCVAVPGHTAGFTSVPFADQGAGSINSIALDSEGTGNVPLPALDIDNIGVQPEPIAPVSLTPAGMDGHPEGHPKAPAETDQRRKELESGLASGPVAMAYSVSEGTPHSVRLHVRGEPDKPGAGVPRGFIHALGHAVMPAGVKGSGRLELANWITRPDNPLTARVMVNRLWQYHFGQGLAATPNDFGARSTPPAHPELLDHLASQFIRKGWSLKAMHRLILLSATWQQGSTTTAAGNPGAGALYTSFPRRRLGAEEIRDAILAVSGTLDRAPGMEHPFPPAPSWAFTQHAPFYALYDHDRRSVYLMVQRIKRHPFLALFDGADPNASTPLRGVTTVPTQALFFLNDPFVHAKSLKFAERLRAASNAEPKQIELAGRLALGRMPTEGEQAEAAEFLAAYRVELGGAGDANTALAAYARTLFGSNEFLHCD